MKFSTTTVSSYKQDQEKSDAPAVKQWLNPNEIPNGSEVEYVFMTEDPLEFWELWADRISDGKANPLRWSVEDHPEGPTDEEILAVTGKEYVRQLSKYENKKRGIKKGDPRPADLCMAWPVWNCEEKCFQVLKISQKSLQSQIIKTSMLKKYRNKMEHYNHTIHKGLVSDIVTYTYNAIERDDDFEEELVMGLWEEQECEMELLLTNGEPFNPGGKS